jgi:3-phenylpropionate/trans-cinnamate dioxygenase ferredoxin reductase subunit
VAKNETVVIVGAGMTGAKAAETLRGEGFEGPVLLVGDEPERPYERPPLSKTYLRGESDFEGAAIHGADFYDTHDIELRTTTTVTAIDPASSTVTLDSGDTVAFDRLLLTTGARPRTLPVPGADLPGVHLLRSVRDSDALRGAITGSHSVVVIGGGWIGAEVAASARQLGADVSLVEVASVVLDRVLGPEMGAVYRDLHTEHGVRFHFGAQAEAFRGDGAVEAVVLADGTVLPADVVVVGVGVVPRTELAQAAGLELDNGVVVDQYLATSVPGVYAAGDVANAFHPRYGEHIRLEHWSAALNQGPVAARNMLGTPTPYEKIPYFFSDQYDLGMEYRGWAPSWDQVVFRGSPERREFIAFWLRAHRVVAALNANMWDVGETLQALVGAGVSVDPVTLADPATDLAALIPSGD